MVYSYGWCDGMKIGKATWFLVGYIPVYLIIMYLAYVLFFIKGECAGGGCAEITLFDWVLFGVTVLIFALMGIFVYMGLKKKKVTK